MQAAVSFLGVAAVATAAFFMVGPQRGGLQSPAGYTGRSVMLGAIASTATDAVCSAAAKGHARLVCLADELKKGLDAGVASKLQRPYSVAEAKRWSNFPPAGYRDRVGPTLGEFTPAQLVIIKALLEEAAGIAADEGYDEMEQIVNADDFLKNNTTGSAGFASGNYHIAFLGTPAASGTWQLYFGGHHLAFANTYRDGALAGATPSFRGVEPFTAFRENGRDNRPMAQEQAAFAAVLSSLDATEQASARLNQIYTDLVVGPQRDDNFPTTRAGLRVGSLSPAKQDLVLKAIGTYVLDIDPPNAEAILARYRAQLPETHLAFAGSTSMDAENDYVRVDGPSVWIEVSIQPGRSVPGIHPHSVWRDRATDYGGNR